MAKNDEEKEGAEAKGGGSKKMIIIIVPVVLLLAGAGWFFFLKPKDGATTALPEPAPGAVVKLDSITVNLAGGHFLKLGMAIQPTKAAKEVDGSKALDLAISEFSQMNIKELTDNEGRAKAKDELVARVKLAYLPEGTDVAAATAGASSTKAATTTAKPDENAATKEEIKIAELPGEQVIKMADALTVQPEVYNIYFTEFVMQ